MHEQGLGRVAHAGPLALGVDRDGERHGEVGGRVHVDVAVAPGGGDHRHPAVLGDGAFPYAITPLEGIKSKVGPDVKVNFALNNDNNAAVEAAKASDVVIVVVGNHPTCDAGWAKCEPLSDGKESIDRRSIDLQPVQEQLIEDVFKANPRTIVVLKASFPFAINWVAGERARHRPHGPQQPGGGQRAGRRSLRRLQSGRPAGADLGEVHGRSAAYDGLQHPQRPHLHVLQRSSRCIRSATA